MKYDKYEKKGDIHWQWYRNDPLYKSLVDETIRPFDGLEGTLVDIGCGDGLPFSLLAQNRLICSGVEPDAHAMEILIEKTGTRHFQLYEMTAEKFAEKHLTFDYLYCLNTIEHMENPYALVQIMGNIAKFAVIVTDDGSLNKDKDKYHNVEYTRETFKALFADFKLEEIPLTDKRFFAFKISPL